MSDASPTPRSESPSSDGESPKERLLAAAEILLAEHGLEAASIRAVTQAAGMSVSAAHYHFGSKEALVHEVFRRRLGPLNAVRLSRLERAKEEARARQEPLTVEAILGAFIRPGFELRSSEGPDLYRLLAARLHSGPSPALEKVRTDLLEPALSRFLDALGEALPGRPAKDLALAVQFTIGSILHVIAGPAIQFSDHEPVDDEAVVDRLVRFGAAGIRAASCVGSA